MRIPRIYTPQSITPPCHIDLEEEASHHLLKVLRMQTGRPVLVFNNSGMEYSAQITATTKKRVTLAIERADAVEHESPLITELAIGISRGDRFDWVLQKATELGVTRIAPLFTERTEVKLQGERLQKRQQQWQKIVIGACEQCQRNRLPDLAAAQTIDDYLQRVTSDVKLLLHHRADQGLRNTPVPKSAALLIGPEGGLSEREINTAEQYGFTALRLGPRVLRTETAPIAALTVLQSLWGDFLM